jgi:hypothetical protein
VQPGEGPEKAVNGSVAGGQGDRWCFEGWQSFLQTDPGAVQPVKRFVVKHASAGGEREESDTRDFNIRLSNDARTFTGVASSSGAGFVDERTEYHRLIYFDGRREARLHFADGKLERRDVDYLRNFEEDRLIFTGIFQYFYLWLAIFFGCLGIKRIGTDARVDLEAFFGTMALLDLRVKVNPDWRNDDRALDDIGVPRSTRRERKPRRSLNVRRATCDVRRSDLRGQSHNM